MKTMKLAFHLYCAGLDYFGHFTRGPALTAASFNFLHDVHSFDDFAEHHVMSVQPSGLNVVKF